MSSQVSSRLAVRGLTLTRKLQDDLIGAVKRGDLLEVTKILADKAFDEKHQDSILGEAICESCTEEQPEITKHLLDVAKSISARLPNHVALKAAGKDGCSPLILALKKRLTDTITVLIDCHAADPGLTDSDGRNALVYCWDTASVQQILKIRPDNNKNLVNAKDKNGTTALMWVLDKIPGPEAARQLLEIDGIDVNAKDNEGRTALMTAIWRDNLDLVRELAARSKIDNVDQRNRNALHHLAVDTARAKDARLTTDATILKILLEQKIPLNAVDWTGCTPLAIALSSGNCNLATLLMMEPDCEVNTTSFAGWNMLHMACKSERTTKEIVKALIDKGLNVNTRTRRSQKTSVHIAAQTGNLEVLEYLLEKPEVDRLERDVYGDTPMLCAAGLEQEMRAQIGKLLAPWHKWTIKHLESRNDYATIKDAAKAWRATVVDFDPAGLETNLPKQYSIYDLINKPQFTDDEAKDGHESSVPFFRTRPQTGRFRWIHLPANNISWCRDLITKTYIERGCEDVQGFRELERTLNNQHRGQDYHLHSRYMTPTCQAIYSSSTYANKPSNRSTVGSQSDEYNNVNQRSFPSVLASPGDVNNPLNTTSGAHVPESFSGSRQATSRSDDQVKYEQDRSVGHICMYMPYLHHEKFYDMITMERELDKMIPKEMRPVDANSNSKSTDHIANVPNDLHEKLFKAYLQWGKFSLHIRRTLDQFFYHNLTTKRRDRSQVIHRYQEKAKIEPHLQRILMVDQLWMWIIGEDLIITSFPRCWTGGENDGLDMLENTMEGVMNTSKDSIKNVFQLGMAIASRFQGTHDAQGFDNNDPRALEMFSAEIGDAMDQEVRLFARFAAVASQADYGKRDGLAETLNYRKFNKTFLNIKKETELLKLVKDIRDELGMLKVLFESQKHIVPSFQAAIENMSKQHLSYDETKRMIDKGFEEQARNIERPLDAVRTMDKQIERVYESIRDLLDLKQKHVNAVEARFAREQATSASRSGKTLMLFTIVTVIFLPLSFIAAFFAIPIEVFRRHGSVGSDNQLALRYVSKYMFGIGVPLALVFVLIALFVGPFAPTLQDYWRRSLLCICLRKIKSWKLPTDNALSRWLARHLPKKKTHADEPNEPPGEESSSEEDDDDNDVLLPGIRMRSVKKHIPCDPGDSSC